MLFWVSHLCRRVWPKARNGEFLQVGDKVQVIANNEISSEPVITFIHRQEDVGQRFLRITTLTKKVLNFLKITEDHLILVEKEGEASAIPARNVIVGDTVYVRGDRRAQETDAVQGHSHVYEKGVYAPVTLSGTILVNDVHTSCYLMCCLMSGPTGPWVLLVPCITCLLGCCDGSAELGRKTDFQAGVEWLTKCLRRWTKLN